MALDLTDTSVEEQQPLDRSPRTSSSGAAMSVGEKVRQFASDVLRELADPYGRQRPQRHIRLSTHGCASWRSGLVSLDDPSGAEGRHTVTVDEIVERARRALEPSGQNPPGRSDD